MTLFFLCFIPTIISASTEQEKIAKNRYTLLLKELFLEKTEEIIISRNSLYELDVLPKEESKRTLCCSLDRTKTLFGKIYLETVLTNPIKNTELLYERQKKIETLLNNKELRCNIRGLLEKIATKEQALLAYFNDESADHAKLEDFYFSSRFGLQDLNSSATALNIKQYAATCAQASAMAGLSVLPLFFYGANSYRLEQYAKPEKDKDNSLDWPTIFSKSFINPLRLYDPRITLIQEPFKKTGGDTSLLLAEEQKIPLWLAYAITYSKQSTIAFTSYKTVSRIFSFFKKEQKQEALLSTALKDITALTDAAKEIKRLLQKEYYEDLFFNEDTFLLEEKGSSFGTLLILHKKMQNLVLERKELVKNLGEIDAYAAIAESMDRLKKEARPCCFVTYEDAKNPTISLKNFWHPLAVTQQSLAATNSLDLSEASETKGWVLTGPHGCGKSTIMRSVMITILLAQSFGIAFADQAHISCFDSLNTYLAISEDRDKGWSTFMAEQDAAEEILKKIRNTEKSFTVFDELFKGTLEKEGGKRVVDLGLNIAALPHALCMMATHAELATELEQKTGALFKNYHGEIVDLGDGRFNHTYMFLPGQHSWWFHDDLKRERFIDYLGLQRIKKA